MNHDPMCSKEELLKIGVGEFLKVCQCDLIAKVRADETNQIRDRHDRHSGLVCSDSYGRGLNDAMRELDALVADMQCEDMNMTLIDKSAVRDAISTKHKTG